ncbi:RidA family protein [Pseudemcibacter aquimaris]|uniref:RidA family protein n=1 Tax=Pseudemcibacter aquimaris TaxID=2857064 RepID=UPI0020128A2F|nr:RidA family protein [Pseudemcibacter aquimaris]MCC3859676.1 RidA family protein [Pseudemcibacter aquimaris]WDU60071.1 RidA family protein [Pseudemcibacter aquimaris]
MKTRSINSPKAQLPEGGYSQAVEVVDAKRTLYISGQIPVNADGNVPTDFAGQARLTWQNIEHQLNEAGMTFDNIVKHTTFLSSREYRDENSRVRNEMLGDRTPALTVIIADIYDEAWLLEVEVIACK